MKKKIVMLMTGMICAVTFLSACEASKGLETDTLKITQYKGVEVAQVQKPGEITDEEVDHKIWAALDAQAETKDI